MGLPLTKQTFDPAAYLAWEACTGSSLVTSRAGILVSSAIMIWLRIWQHPFAPQE